MSAVSTRGSVRRAMQAEKVRATRAKYLAACRHFDALDANAVERAHVIRAAFAALGAARAFIDAKDALDALDREELGHG